MWHNRLTPSKQNASSRPFPSILVTCAYSVQRGSDGWQVAQGSVAVELQRATLTILLEGQLTLGL